MKTLVRYYKLVIDKEMSDGTIIKKGQELVFLKKEDELFFMKSLESDCVKLFWSNESEIIFLKEILEDEKINKINFYINSCSL